MLQISLGLVPVVNGCFWDFLITARAGVLRSNRCTKVPEIPGFIFFSLWIPLHSATGFKAGRL